MMEEMETFDISLLQKLYKPHPSSHKGENGKLLLIGGSKLFHAASLWSLQVASRIVDMVFYASVPENNAIVEKAKEEFRNGIVVPREHLEAYIQEADTILIGPGMVRTGITIEADIGIVKSLNDIEKLSDNEGKETFFLTGYLLNKYPKKQWVLDAGALQMMRLEWFEKLETMPIITPHQKEFEMLFANELGIMNFELWKEKTKQMARKYNITILLKGERDIIVSPDRCVEISGGNAGMTKGGTGDVLAGLVASLYCKNDAFLSATAGSYINKIAGEALFKRVGYNFNASDLVEEIPRVMKELVI